MRLAGVGCVLVAVRPSSGWGVPPCLPLALTRERHRNPGAWRVPLCMESGTPSRDTARAMSEESVELVGKTHDELLEIDRVVCGDALFLRQVQPEWKP